MKIRTALDLQNAFRLEMITCCAGTQYVVRAYSHTGGAACFWCDHDQQLQPIIMNDKIYRPIDSNDFIRTDLDEFELELENYLFCLNGSALAAQRANFANYAYNHRTHYFAEYRQKFAVVVRDTSAFCFVALNDGGSKVTGDYKQGDILKAASWKQPAKGVRGHVRTETAKVDGWLNRGQAVNV